MGAARKLISEAEYLAAERLAEEKHEYIDGSIYAMAGASWVHNKLSSNLNRRLGNLLEGGPCEALAADMRVYARGAWVYPDVVVYCGAPEFVDGIFDTLTNPSVIIEILSESTERNDRGPKFRKYESIETVNEIVFVAQEEARVEHFQRLPDGSWRRVVAVAGGRVAFPSLNVELPVDVIYAGVPLSEG